MHARIYQPTKSAMQSGRSGQSGKSGQSDQWVLEFPRNCRATPDQLMGWQSSSDTAHTIRIKFPSIAAAVAYAEGKGLAFHIIKAGARVKKHRAYADNFSATARAAWTH